jgi:putative FmdB family regulatory protein
MPLYEYECDNGHRFEVIVKFSDPPLESCPTCAAPVHKLMSSPAFQFKGTGWYITDYARKDAEKKSGAEKKEGEKKEAKESKESKDGKESTATSTTSSTDASSTSSTESKPAAASNPKTD